MPEINNANIELWRFISIVAFFVLFGLLVEFFKFTKAFSAELRYLNVEIERTEGTERKYWIRRRRRLWLSLIPFIKY